MGLRKLLEQAKTSGKINKCPMSDYDEAILFKILKDAYFDNIGFWVFDFRPYQEDKKVNLKNVEIFVDLYIQAQHLEKSLLLGSPRPHFIGKVENLPELKQFGLSDYWIEISCQDSKNLDVDVLTLLPQFIVGSQTLSDERFVRTFDIYNFLIEVAEQKEKRGKDFLPMLRLFKATASDAEEKKHNEVISADENLYKYLRRERGESENFVTFLRDIPRFSQIQYEIGDFISQDNGIYKDVKKAVIEGQEVYVAPVETPQAGDIIKGIMLGEDIYLNLLYEGQQTLFYKAEKPLSAEEKKVLHLLWEDFYDVMEKHQKKIDSQLHKLGMQSPRKQLEEENKILVISHNTDYFQPFENQKDKGVISKTEIGNTGVSKEIRQRFAFMMVGTELNGYFFKKE